MRKALISQGFSVWHLNRPQHLVGEGGFEPPKLKAADLQSVPFGHSGTLPNPTTTTITQAFPFVKRKITLFKSFLRAVCKFLLTAGGKLDILCLF